MKKKDLEGNEKNFSEEEKEKRIEAELKRIGAFYSSMNKGKKAVIAPILQNAAFMRVTLEDLQKLILEEGVTDEYVNGANQHGRKQSAALQAYNALVKNYASVSKTLTQMLPPERKITLPPKVMGKTLMEWRSEKAEAEEDDPRLCFISFEDWLEQKAEEYVLDPDEYGASWVEEVKRKKAEEDDDDPLFQI